MEKGKRRAATDVTNTVRRRRSHVRLLRQRGLDLSGATRSPLPASCLTQIPRSTRLPIDQPSPSSCASASAPPPNCGCAYLQAVHEQIRAGKYTTTSGDYLETIFTHREALFAFPQGHRACAAGRARAGALTTSTSTHHRMRQGRSCLCLLARVYVQVPAGSVRRRRAGILGRRDSNVVEILISASADSNKCSRVRSVDSLRSARS